MASIPLSCLLTRCEECICSFPFPSLWLLQPLQVLKLSPAFDPALVAGDKVDIGKDGSCGYESVQGEEGVKKRARQGEEGQLGRDGKEESTSYCLSYVLICCIHSTVGRG